MSISTFGACPTQKNKTISRGLFTISLFCVLFGVVIPQFCRIFQVWQDLDRLSNVLCSAELAFIVASTKMIVLYRNKKKMTTLYDYMMADWKRKKSTEELDIMIENGRKGRRFSLICIVTGHVTVTFRMFQWILENIPNWRSPEYYKNYTLFADAYYPFTWNYNPAFEFVTSFEYIGIILATCAYSGSDAYFSQISTHYTAQFHILLSNLNQSDRHHLCTSSQCESILVTYENPSSSNTHLVSEQPLVNLQSSKIGKAVFIGKGTGLLSSYEFADTAYKSEWYNLPSQKAKLIILLIQSGNKPVEITAGKFFVFNFKLFGSIVKTSLGYLSFLITMKESQ
ncbi:uncharacterized protein LOC122501198 [Leptopilina heterotoma]|uniref:uncharacterized protein LOC122501198 n=1 Tax=Leptopilina heterotoma TaxID=63436 RepID=UPI001CA86B87|nr:uncharacterized protein LOC122501198 [Leptopilina heterotoma]